MLGDLPELSERGRVRIAEAAKVTGASRNTIKDHVRALADRRHLTRHGASRGAWYAPG
jgi:DeoR/GlpR family transcriptional regulator of sugar metabolism